MPVTGSSALGRGTKKVGALVVGDGGTVIKSIKTGTIDCDPANAAAAGAFETSLTISGVAAGDIVIFEPPASLEANLVYSGARVSAADTVQLRLAALAAVNGASRTWRYIIINAE